MEDRNSDAKMSSSEKPEPSISSVRSGSDSSKSPKKPIVLGVVNPVAGRTSIGNVLRKRRWDQPPENEEKNQASTVKTDKPIVSTSSSVKVETFLENKNVDNKAKVGNLDSFKESSGSIKQLQGNESVSKLPNIVGTKAVSSISPENTSVKPVQRLKLVRPKYNVVKEKESETNVKVPEKSVSILETSCSTANISNTKSAGPVPSVICKDQKETENSNSVETPQLKSTALMMISSYDDSPSEDSLPETEIELVQEDSTNKFDSASESDPYNVKNKSNIGCEDNSISKFISNKKLEEVSPDGKKELADETKSDDLKNSSDELSIEEQMEKMFSVPSESPISETLVTEIISDDKNSTELFNTGNTNSNNECESSKINSDTNLIKDYDIFEDNTATEIISEPQKCVDERLVKNSEGTHLAVVENIDLGESKKNGKSKIDSADVELGISKDQKELDDSNDKCKLTAERNLGTQIENTNLFHTELQESTDQLKLNKIALEKKSLETLVNINNEENPPVTLTENDTISDKFKSKVESKLDVGKVDDCITESVVEFKSKVESKPGVGKVDDSIPESVVESKSKVESKPDVGKIDDSLLESVLENNSGEVVKEVEKVENIETSDENVVKLNSDKNVSETADPVSYSSLENKNSKHSNSSVESIEKDYPVSELKEDKEIINTKAVHRSSELMEGINICKEMYDKSNKIQVSDIIDNSQSTELDLEISKCNKQDKDFKIECRTMSNDTQIVSKDTAVTDTNISTSPQKVQDCNIADTEESEIHFIGENKLLDNTEKQPNTDKIKQISLCSVDSEIGKNIPESKNDNITSSLEQIAEKSKHEEYQESRAESFGRGENQGDSIKEKKVVNFGEKIAHDDKIHVCEESKATNLIVTDACKKNLHLTGEIRITEELKKDKIDENIEEAVEKKLVELENTDNQNILDDEQYVSDVGKSFSSDSSDKTVDMKETHSDKLVQSDKCNVIEERIKDVRESIHEIVPSTDVSHIKNKEKPLIITVERSEKGNIVSKKEVNINKESEKIKASRVDQSDTNRVKDDNEGPTDIIVSDKCINANDTDNHEIICSKINQDLSRNISKDGKRNIKVELETKKKMHETDEITVVDGSNRGMMQLGENSGKINKTEIEKYSSEIHQIDLGESKDEEENNELESQERLINITESSVETKNAVDAKHIDDKGTTVTDQQNVEGEGMKDIRTEESEISLKIGKPNIDNLNEVKDGSDDSSEKDISISNDENLDNKLHKCDIQFDDREQQKFNNESANAISKENEEDITEKVELISFKADETGFKEKTFKDSGVISIAGKHDLTRENDGMYEKNETEVENCTLYNSGSVLELEQIIQTCKTNEHNTKENATCEIENEKEENKAVKCKGESFEVDLTEKGNLIPVIEDEKEKDNKLREELPEENEKLSEEKLSLQVESKILQVSKQSVAIAENSFSDCTQNSNEKVIVNESNLLAGVSIECRKSLTISDTKDTHLSFDKIGNTSKGDIEDESMEINIGSDNSGEKNKLKNSPKQSKSYTLEEDQLLLDISGKSLTKAKHLTQKNQEDKILLKEDVITDDISTVMTTKSNVEFVQSKKTETVLSCETSEIKLKETKTALPLPEIIESTVLDSADEDELLNSGTLVKSKSIDILLEEELLGEKESNSNLNDGNSSKPSSLIEVNVALGSNNTEKKIDFQNSNKDGSILNSVHKLEKERTQDGLQSLSIEDEYSCENEPLDINAKKKERNMEKFENTETEIKEHSILLSNVSIESDKNDKPEIKIQGEDTVEKQIAKVDDKSNIDDELLPSCMETNINKKQTNKEFSNLVENSKTKGINLVEENLSSDIIKVETKGEETKEVHSLKSEIMLLSEDKNITEFEIKKINEIERGVDNDTQTVEDEMIPKNKEPEIIDRSSDPNRNQVEEKRQEEVESINLDQFSEITPKSKNSTTNESVYREKCEKDNITELNTSNICAQIEEIKELSEKTLSNESEQVKIMDDRNDQVINTDTLLEKSVGNNMKKDTTSLKSLVVNDEEIELQKTSNDSSKEASKAVLEGIVSVEEKASMAENKCEQLQEHKIQHTEGTKTNTATNLLQKTKTVLSVEPVENTIVKRVLKRPFQSLGKETTTDTRESCKSFESDKSELLIAKRSKLQEDKKTNQEADKISANVDSKITDEIGSISVLKGCFSETKQESVLNEAKVPLKTKIVIKKPEEQKLLKLTTETKSLQSTKDMIMKTEKYKGITIKPIIIPSEQSGSSCKEIKSPKHSPKSPITLSKGGEKMLPQTKLEPITLKLSKENPVIMRSQSLSPKTSSDSFKIQDAKAQSVSPQSKTLGYTLKIGKDSTQIIPKDSSGAPSAIKSSEFAKVEHLFKNTGLTITPVVSQEQQESQKLNKITLKLSKAGGHPEIKCEDKCDTWKTVNLPGVDIVPVVRSTTGQNYSGHLMKRLEEIESNISGKKMKLSESSSDIDADPSSKLQGLLTKALPIRTTDPSTSSAAHMANVLAPNTHSHIQVGLNVVPQGKPPVGMPRKRGRPRKVIPPVVPGNMNHEFKLNDMRSDPNMSGGMFPVPLFNLSEPFMETDPQNLFPNQVQPSTGRPQRSCRGRIKLPIVRTRKPRGGGIVKGITRGRGRGRGMKQMLAELMLKMRNIDSSGTSKHDFNEKGENIANELLIKKEGDPQHESNSQGLPNLKSIENFESLNASKVLGEHSVSQSENIDMKEESKEWSAIKIEAEKQLSLEIKRSRNTNRGRQIRLGRVKRLTIKEKKQRREAKRLAQRAKAAAAAAAKPPPPQMFEEETRMSATESNSRAHTPARTANGENPDESMGSDQTNSTNRNKKGRMEVIDLESGKELTVDQVAEYQWPLQGGELYMIQEQISNYLGVKSFKRKYPDLKRRQVEPEERTYLCDSGLVAESMCDLGLTAVSSAEVLDIMYQDFQDKYEDFRKHMREKQAKEMTNKQKAEKRRAEQGQSRMDSKEQAMQSAVSWNQALNKARQEQRRCALDLQTWTVQFPQSRRVNMTKPLPKIGNYPVALIPGQYCDYYRGYTPQELRYFPINTVLYGPMKPNERQVILAGGSDGSQSESEDSSSSDDSSDSSSDGEGTEEEEKEVPICKLCGRDKSKPRDSLTAGCVQCGSGITNNTSAVWG